MSLEDKIREFGQKRDHEDLQEYLSTISVAELLNLVETRLSSANFPYTLDYLLKGLSQSDKKLFEIVLKVVKELEKSNFSSSATSSIICRLCMELDRFNSKQLVELCEFCMECVQAQRVIPMSWKELLPKVLQILSEKDRVEYNDSEVSGGDFKHQFISNLCSFQWFSSNVTSLTEMFTEVSLSKEEHLQVVTKLSKYLEKLIPQEIPAFVYQFLRLCKQHNSRILFAKLQQYFSLRYHELRSDSENSDAIEDAASHDIIEAESTVLFHVHNSALLGQECIKDYLNFLKNLLKAPEFVLSPFQLSMLFTISTVPYYEERVFETVRGCVSKMYHEEEKKAASAWFREMVPKDNSPESVFGQLVDASAQDRDTILQALVDFAFVLLGVGSALGRDPIAEKQWQLGSMILLKIIKRQRHSAPIIVENITSRILTENSVLQYIECLYMLNRSISFLMLENRSQIVFLMEGLVQMPANNAKYLLDAIIPLTKVSPTIRDHFILLLRKALYSRQIDTRQVSVIGFLKLLSTLKISDPDKLSQGSFSGSYSSGHSLYTQLSMRASQSLPSSAFSNEALSLEILNALKRCFMQQAEVKIQLYTGLSNAVCSNPQLGVPALEMIWLHFRDLFNLDEEVLPPLKFDKITVVRDVSVTLQEPLSNLLYCIAIIVTNTNPENPVVAKFTTILDSICKRMSQCELLNFELDDGTDLTDTLPESQQKLYILKEAMGVFEALIGYKFASWQLESENNPQEIVKLFESYSRFLHFLKNLSKPKKKKDANKTTQTLNTTLKKDQKVAKAPDTVLDFPVILKVLNLLYDPMVTWATVGQANLFKSKKDFHQYIMQSTLHLVSTVKNRKIVDVQQAKKTYEHLCEIAKILYQRNIKKLNEFMDFDFATALMVVECFATILTIVAQNYKANFNSHLKFVTEAETHEDAKKDLIQTYQNLLDNEENCDDLEYKKIELVLVNTLNTVSHFLTDKSAISLQLMEWLKNFAVSNTLQSKPVVQSFFNLLLDFHVKCKVSLTFFQHLAARIGDVTGVINEEEHEVEELKIVNELSLSSALLCLCNSVKLLLENTEWIVARLKAEFTMLDYPGELSSERRLEDLKERERSVCCHLCFTVTIMTNLSNCTVPIGNLSEAIMKNLALLFSTLASLTKYFTMRSSKVNPVFQTARFERLVMLVGKELSPVVYKLILYVEESQKEKASKSKDSTSLKGKVLRETRLIPKVVTEIEQFSKCVMQLSKKTKIDLSKFVGQGTVRDFRILHLKEVLDKVSDTMNDTSVSHTSVNESGLSDGEEEDADSQPPTKKRHIEG